MNPRRAMQAVGVISAALGLVTLSAGEDFGVEEHENIERTFPAAKSIDIDNADGSITVMGTEAREVKVEIHKTIRARSAEKVQEAKREVRLDMTQQGDELRLYVDGPFRCKCGDGSFNYRGSHYYGYEVSFDFTVKAPRDTSVRLRTVNHGNIRLENTSGTFDVENINGGVDLVEVAGSGHAYALNRPLKVLYSRNPAGASDFGSLNGDVEVAFQPDLSADVWLKTFNGQAYTDFDVTALPSR
ncbi:MAG TPA: hypothetical protein VNH83_01690, partial [Bryobacteraceae bacterium]|nr:hypothetical protein [Bryobacteraceae bacterium]